MAKKDLLDKIISDLQAASAVVGDLSDLEERKARAQADLDSLNESRTRALNQMNEAEAMLSSAQREAQKRFDLDMFTKQGQLKSLTERVAALEKRAGELAEEVNHKGAQLVSIENGFNEARRRLAG